MMTVYGGGVDAAITTRLLICVKRSDANKAIAIDQRIISVNLR